MLIAQITDFHVRAHGDEGALGIDNNRNLLDAVTLLNRLSPRPDVVLGTGDLTNHGRSEEYEALRDLLAPLEVPVYLIPGNHDMRERLRHAFDHHAYLMAGGEFIHYVVEDFPVRLIGLDTTIADQHNGELCRRRLDWLRARLEESSDRPTLVFMHHPPFESGIWWMDGIGLRDGADELRELLDQHRQVRRIVCGHLHRAVQSELGATPVSVCPSTCYQVYLDTIPESPPKFIAEPPALQLHGWTGHSFVTHTAYVNFSADPIDLVPLMSDWNDRRERTRRGQVIPKSVVY